MGPAGLTAVFGMGTGGAPPVSSPESGRRGGRAPPAASGGALGPFGGGSRSRFGPGVGRGGGDFDPPRLADPARVAGRSFDRIVNPGPPLEARPADMAIGGRVGVVKPLGC